MDGEFAENVDKQIDECIRNARQMFDVSIKIANKKFEESVTDARMRFEEIIANSKHILDSSVNIAKQALEDSINEARTRLTTLDDVSSKINLSPCQQTTATERGEISTEPYRFPDAIRSSGNALTDDSVCDEIKKELIDNVAIEVEQPTREELCLSQKNESPLSLSIKVEIDPANVYGLNEPFCTDQRVNDSQPHRESGVQEDPIVQNSKLPTSLEKQSENYNININQTDSQDVFECHACGIEFITKSFLDEHLCHPYQRIEPNTCQNQDVPLIDWKLKCDVCEDVFPSRKSLNRHVKRIHNLDVKYKCDLCGKSFVKQCRLNRHLKIHKEINIFKCEICGIPFTRKVKLDLHLSIHNGTFKCTVCGEFFRKKKTLKRHQQIHLEELKSHKEIVDS